MLLNTCEEQKKCYICIKSINNQKHIIMTLTAQIKNEPYFKLSNCLDESDLDYGMSRVLELEQQFGKSKMLDKIFEKLFDKKEVLSK